MKGRKEGRTGCILPSHCLANRKAAWGICPRVSSYCSSCSQTSSRNFARLICKIATDTNSIVFMTILRFHLIIEVIQLSTVRWPHRVRGSRRCHRQSEKETASLLLDWRSCCSLLPERKLWAVKAMGFYEPNLCSACCRRHLLLGSRSQEAK